MNAYIQRLLSVRAMYMQHVCVVLRITLVIDTPKSKRTRTCSSRSVFAPFSSSKPTKLAEPLCSCAQNFCSHHFRAISMKFERSMRYSDLLTQWHCS